MWDCVNPSETIRLLGLPQILIAQPSAPPDGDTHQLLRGDQATDRGPRLAVRCEPPPAAGRCGFPQPPHFGAAVLLPVLDEACYEKCFLCDYSRTGTVWNWLAAL